MPVNPHKQRCAIAGCRAWAMRGETLCAGHLHRRSDPDPEPSSKRLNRAIRAIPPTNLSAESQLTHLLHIQRTLQIALEDGAMNATLSSWAETTLRVARVILRHLPDDHAADLAATLDAITADLEAALCRTSPPENS